MTQSISKGTGIPELLQECCCSNCMLNSMEMGRFAGKKEIIQCTSTSKALSGKTVRAKLLMG